MLNSGYVNNFLKTNEKKQKKHTNKTKQRNQSEENKNQAFKRKERQSNYSHLTEKKSDADNTRLDFSFPREYLKTTSGVGETRGAAGTLIVNEHGTNHFHFTYYTLFQCNSSVKQEFVTCICK